MYIERIEQLEKGRRRLVFETGERLVLYKGEIRSYDLSEGQDIPETLYQELLCDVLGKRATKRAMHLLEKQDRTEYQLREKLRQNEYPKEAVEQAIAYVKSYHYIDDLRYATTYISYQQKKKSRQKLKMDLIAKGIEKSVIEQALDEVFDSDEQLKIRQLLEKKHYEPKECDRKEQQKIYQYLMRRGFKSSDILHVMKILDEYEE